MFDLATRPRIHVVTALILDGEGRMLMAKRPVGRPRPGMWENPGGKIEGPEHARAALRREVREELDVDSEISESAIARVRLRMEVLVDLLLYRVRIVGEPKPMASDELRWIDPVDAITNYACAPGTYGFFDDVVEYIARRRKPR